MWEAEVAAGEVCGCAGYVDGADGGEGIAFGEDLLREEAAREEGGEGCGCGGGGEGEEEGE